MKRTIVLMILCLLAALLLFSSCFGTEEEPDPTTVPEQTTGAPPEHDHVWDEGRVTVEGTCDPATQEETKGEIMYTCTICGETRTEETEGHKWDESKDKVLTPATCVDKGEMLRTCSNCNKKDLIVIPATGVHDYKASGRLVTAPTADRVGEAETLCKVCGAPSTEPAPYAEYKAKVDAAKAKLSGFSASDFGGSNITADLGNKYAAPTVHPTKGQHPRVMFNENDIAGINRALNNGLNTAAATEFRRQLTLMETGKLPAAYVHGDNGTHNFNGQVLSNIMALALDYQLSGNEISGYQAIYAAKNYLKTIDVQSFKPDPERTMGNVMYAMACVYDWCHPLMTKTDKDQIVAGVQHKCCESSHMEVGFPPAAQGAVAGHGCEFQILRDYLSFAIAIYDEYPGWWNYVGGRFYEQYVPVRNEFYKAGMVPQGVSQYVQIRFAADCYSALLIKSAIGTFPFESEAGMKQVIRTVYSHELPNASFASGDGSTATKKLMDYGMAAMISQHLFNDATIRAQFETNKYSYSIFGDGQYGFDQTVGYACEELICSSGEVKAAKNIHEGMDLIVYNGGWLGQMIARNNWSSEQAAVLMKIGVRADSNHGHQDAGQFQIWYKGMLAGDTGVYASYNHEHWKKYHQATIAHNSILIGGNGQISHTQETGSLSGWTNGSYEIGVVNGHEAGYADAAKKTATYAYIAGDIAKAYGSAASEVTRRMLAVYDTGNRDVPMFFFVFDNVTAGSSAQKTFLLHTVREPEISGKTVTVKAGSGKLVLQNVIGGDTINSIGGKTSSSSDPATAVKDWKNYYVNGTQIVPNRYYDDGYWGRVEISTKTGTSTSQMLNVMYVCDASKTPEGLTATKIFNTKVSGAVIGNVAAVFVNASTRASSALSFTANGSGDLTYYVSGVKAGTWRVSVGGTVKTVTATEDGGLLVFTAPAGSVSLSPQS